MGPWNGDELILAVVRERDVDLLVVEEAHSSRSFQEFLFGRLFDGLPGCAWHPGAEVSVRHSVSGFDEGVTSADRGDELLVRRGETDIEISFRIPSGGDGGLTTCIALLENKIDARFTDLQPERYASRARVVAASGHADEVRTGLLAPDSYLGAVPPGVFDVHISYEVLSAYFEEAARRAGPELSARLAYRSEVLRHASSRARRTGATVVHPTVSDFRRAYYERVTELYPDIGMRAPKSSGQWAGDAWIEFYDALKGIPTRVKGEIKHKCPKGTVDLQLRRWGPMADLVRPYLSPILEPDMEVRRAHNSLAIGIAVPPVQPQAGYGAQSAALEDGMRAARRLQLWFRANHAAVEEVGRRIGLLDGEATP